MYRWVLPIALAACGRVGFDEPDDAGGGSGSCPIPAPRYVGGTCDLANNTTMVSVGPLPVTAGHLLVVAADFDTPAATPTISDSKGHTYALIAGPLATPSQGSRVWLATMISSGDVTVTLTLDLTSPAMTLYAHEYEAGYFHASSGITGSGPTATTRPLTTRDGETSLLAYALATSQITGVAQPFSPAQGCNANLTATRDRVPLGTYTAQFSVVTSAPWQATIIELGGCP